MSNHCRGKKTTKKRKMHLSWASPTFLPAWWWMTALVLSVCACLSIAVVQSDQGQAPTEKGPVPQLMSSIIQMESLLSVHRAVVRTLLSQAALTDAPLPHVDALSVYQLLKCMWENKAPWKCWCHSLTVQLAQHHAGDHTVEKLCYLYLSIGNTSEDFVALDRQRSQMKGVS